MLDGRTLSWDDAIAKFRDTTGRAGPSTWELGTYPDGQDDWPVNGVSWYEAAAYAAFAGKALPTTYHWYRASGAFGIFSEILRVSNFGGRGPARVGASGSLGPFGTHDMAGNVKEWTWNEKQQRAAVRSRWRLVRGRPYHSRRGCAIAVRAQPGLWFLLHPPAHPDRVHAHRSHRHARARRRRAQACRR